MRIAKFMLPKLHFVFLVVSCVFALSLLYDDILRLCLTILFAVSAIFFDEITGAIA